MGCGARRGAGWGAPRAGVICPFPQKSCFRGTFLQIPSLESKQKIGELLALTDNYRPYNKTLVKKKDFFPILHQNYVLLQMWKLKQWIVIYSGCRSCINKAFCI